MEELDVAAILSEEDEPGAAEWREQCCSSSATSTLHGVSSEVIEEACSALLSDSCIADDIKMTVGSADKSALLASLKFLDQCLVKKGKFATPSKEQAYSNFHREVQANCSMVEQVTSPTSAMWVCLKVFEILVHRNYDTPALQSHQSESSDVSQEEVDIVEYIGGYVIHSLKKQANRTTKADEKANMLQCLAELTLLDDQVSGSDTSTASTSFSAPKSLTQVLDRGVLTRIKPDVVQVFVALESIFRECFTGEKQALSFDLYFSKCCQSDCVTTCLFEQLYSVCTSVETKENLMRGIVKSYFKVRAHHKCKSYMDRHRLRTNTSRKQKGLRKSVKLAGTSSSV